MKRKIRLTESDLVRIVKRVIEEQQLIEEQYQILSKLFRGASKAVKPLIKSKPIKSSFSRPLIDQLPSKVTGLIYKLPEKIKVGPKLQDVFTKSKNDIISLEGSLGNLSQTSSEFLMTHSLTSKIKKIMSSPKGSVINLKELYRDVHLIKKDLQNWKEVIRTKQSPSLKTMNVKDVDKFFGGIEFSINRIISNLDETIKDGSQFIKK
jgi:DNA helicase TIP49 (TBP-interacting protein)